MNRKMKLTLRGYRISKNGSIMSSIEKEAFTSSKNLGLSTKQNGTYYLFDRKQGETYVYLP